LRDNQGRTVVAAFDEEKQTGADHTADEDGF
jgi:hypothetical protein